MLKGFLPPCVRILAHSPAFAGTAVAIVALGVALATTGAAIVDAVVHRPIPVNRVDQLFRIQSGVFGGVASAPDARDVFDRTDEIAFSYGHRFAVEYLQDGRVGLITLCEVQGKAFETLLWHAITGRLLQGGDYVKGSEPVAVLSHKFWQSAFGGDEGVVGRSIHLNGKAFRIVGVLAPQFDRVSRTIEPDAWTPLVHTFDDWIYDNRNLHGQTIIARLTSASDSAAFRTRLEQLEAFLKQTYPEATSNLDLSFIPEVVATRAGSKDAARQSNIIAALVAAVLLIACFNVGNMLLANAYRREREFAIRRAVGASPFQIAKQLFAESSIVASLGGIAGVALAYWLTAFADRLPMSRGVDVRLDDKALSAAVAAVVFTAIVSSLAPIWHLARGAAADALKRDARAAHIAVAPRILVVIQLAICATLASATVLYTLYLQQAYAFDPGYDAERLAFVEVSLQSVPVERRERAAQDLRDRLAALPGVESASFATFQPLRSLGRSYLRTDRFQPDQEVDRCVSGFAFVSQGHLKTLGVPLLEGRDVRDDEAVWPFRVVLINEAFQRRFWPEGDALGQEFWPWGGDGEERVRIVGIFKDFPLEPWTDPEPLFLIPQSQSRTTMFVRAAGDPRSLLSSLLGVNRRASNEFVAREIQFYSDAQARAFRTEWSTLIVLVTLAISALFLSAAGIWYTTRQIVKQSGKELAIRQALGATPGSLLRLSLWRSLQLITAGLAFGALLSAGAFKLIQANLERPAAINFLPYVLIAALLFFVAFVASYLPARAVLKVNPRAALSDV